ncbi:thiol reductant ABC exporter subunit CydC [Desulfosporosinus sp.]|uniref:thiol reductant ABC exporter subunit CydC n=1 Tax=Desulfosporosinus sp. TaxID=157907 RepID=UPI0025B7CDD5|nr:thiol reductant ABC exporter subunit CydC [Desulfosporosinus sp.]MBC2723799.1 thiol reductant ABC exporter subunit CydC [Desulfosporosinus sp.]MBC2725523.1 thiol reductant ABC exporter subunit CydC [Desulfosporosinus sp.]
MKSLKWLIHLILPYWRRILLALILSTLTITSHIGLMATSAYLLARAALHPPVLDLMVTIVGVRFFGLSRAVFRYLERYVSHDVTFRILSQIRVKFYQGLEPLAPARLLNFRSADLLSRIVADVEIQQNLFLKVFAPPIVALLVLCGYGAFLASYDIRFSVILSACFLVAGLGIPLIIKLLSQGVGRQLVVLKAELNTQVADSLFGMSEILAYGQANVYLARIRRTNEKVTNQQRQIVWLSALSSALTGMLANVSMWLILVLGIVLVEEGKLSGVNLGMLALGTLSSFEALFPLALVPHHLEQNRVAADRLLELIQAEPEIKNQDTMSPKPREMSITFQEVNFRYGPEEPWALNCLSFHIPEQSKVAIVGASGAGKTSIVNLLLGFWDYEEGRIDFGGYSIQEYTQQKIRDYVGVVTQRTHIFNATIRENLLLAKPEANDEELILAAKKAKLHDFVKSFSKGYDSYVGEGGLKLSGGQRQRLAIARVLLKNAPILILDEAMEGLDPFNEREVMREVYQLMEGRTTLVITHRLSGLERMDEILVLDQGQVVERGKHHELLRQKGFYRKLWDMQVIPLN